MIQIGQAQFVSLSLDIQCFDINGKARGGNEWDLRSTTKGNNYVLLLVNINN